MDKEGARIIINKYNLLSGKISRQILKAIQGKQDFDTNSLPRNISIEKLHQLRKLYQEKLLDLEKMKVQEEYPRHLPFYYILKDKFPSFSWVTNKSLANGVEINAPRIENLRPSLISLLINDIIIEKDTPLPRQYLCVKKLPPDLVRSFFTLMEDIQALYPDNTNMEGIVSWLYNGLQGRPLTIFSAVCPDYSVEKTGDPQCLYKHTFNELGSNIGLVAQRILDALPRFENFFKQYNIKVTPIIAMGDFEAYAEDNLKRLNISNSEFLSRLQKSHNLTKKSSKVPVNTIMFTELCEGYNRWDIYFKKYKTMLDEGNYGNSNLDKKSLLDIIKARKPLYDRWLGKRNRLEDYLPQLLGQGAEYATMGAIINQNYNNCLILGADHSVMAPFYKVDQFIPTLYLKRFYC